MVMFGDWRNLCLLHWRMLCGLMDVLKQSRAWKACSTQQEREVFS